MGEDLLTRMRKEAETIFRSSIDAVQPRQAVRRFVQLEDEKIVLGYRHERRLLDLEDFDRIFVVGAGKATAPMAKALEDLLGPRLYRGVINVKYGFTEPLSRIKTVEAGHPLPDAEGVRGTAEILRLLEEAGERDLIFSLISGGGSSLLPHPAQGVTLEEKQALTQALLDSGATIREINTVRKHISAAKGGWMAKAASPATVVNLMLSDVVGDPMDAIASGPFVPDPSSYAEARDVLRKYKLEHLSKTILDHILDGVSGRIPETPKPADPCFKRVYSLIVGSNILALKAAQKKARELGYQAFILSSMLEGEAREIARIHTAIAREILKSANPLSAPACVISGGETTVTIRGNGLGGRNQEFSLAAAGNLSDLPPRVVILSAGTDGNDGPTGAAGAVVDPFTLRRGEKAGMRAVDFLDVNDAYHFLEETRDLLITGPTNTNVMDVQLILVR